MFLLTRPMRDVTGFCSILGIRHTFLLTRPMRDVTVTGDKPNTGTETFLLTRPMRDVTTLPIWMSSWSRFLLTRPMRDVTSCVAPFCVWFWVSTHTPHAGRDFALCRFRALYIAVSTHTPHAGRDGNQGLCVYLHRGFYSHAPCGT